MKLQRIDLRQLPGIDRGFAVDGLEPTVNFVTGPNASGKSSLIRALRYLLAGHRPGDPHQLSLSAGFHDGEHRWTVDRNGSHVAWQCDGQTTEPPALPPPDALDSYLIGVEDLLQVQGSSEQALARHLRRELNGGLDLPALREALFPRAPRAGHKERRELDTARRQREEVEREQRQTADEERHLPELERELQDAQHAQQEQQALDTALQLLDTERTLQALEARLATFPPDMDRLTGREPARLDDLARQRQRAQQELEEAGHARQQARARLADTGLETARPDEDELERLRARLEELGRLEHELRRAATECTDARTARDQAIARLGQHEDTARELPRLDDASLDRAQDLVRRRQELEDRRAALQARLSGAPEASPEVALQHHERGAALLREWLALPAPDTDATPWIPTTAGATLGAGAAVIGGILGAGWLAVLGGGVTLLSLVPLWFPRVLPEALRRSPKARARAAEREHIVREFQALDLEPPESETASPPTSGAWQSPAVRARLDAIEQQRDELRMTRRRFEEARTLRAERDTLDATLEELEAERAGLAREAGFDPALAGRLDDFLARTRALQQAELALQQAEARRAETARQAQDLSRTLREALAHWPVPGGDPGSDAHSDLAPAVEALRARTGRAIEAERQISEMEREEARLRETLADIDRQQAREMEEVGLAPDQRAVLEQRLEQREAWRTLKNEHQEQRLRRDDLASRLDARPDLLELARAGERDHLARRHAETSEQAARLEELQDRRGRIRERIRQTGTRREREQALAAEQAAGERLEELRDQALDAETGQFLLDDIQDEFRREEEPELLRRAREAFGRFTHHQWDLRLSEHEDGFLGEDRVQGALRSPGELSTATRMQLLLALRLARVETREALAGPLRWPLLVDEALATTDPERAAVMFRSFHELAEAGERQILYLAASDYEVQLWHQATGEWPHRVDLQTLRGLSRKAGEPARFSLPAAPAIPEPGDMDTAAWARELGVAAPDPGDAPGDVHLLHVLFDDPGTARDLMQDWRVERVGPLRNLLESRLGARALPDDPRRAALEHRCQALEYWLETLSIGRHGRVDRGILEVAKDQGVLTDTSLEGVVQRAAELEGDPAALLDSLEQQPITMATGNVQRLRANQREQLHEFLRERGVLDEREPLSAQQRRHHVLERLPGDADIADIQRLLDQLEATSDG